MKLGPVLGDSWKLRPAHPGDSAAIREHGQHPDSWWIGISDTAPPERADHVLDEFLKGPSGQFGLARLAVLTSDESAIVGMICAKSRGRMHVEVLYGTAPAFRGRGLATELLARVSHDLQESAEWDRCVLVIGPTNSPSIKVAERCGYVSDGYDESGDPVYVSEWSSES